MFFLSFIILVQIVKKFNSNLYINLTNEMGITVIAYKYNASHYIKLNDKRESNASKIPDIKN